ncbi:Peptidase dimerization domain [Phytophthora infestans]|uniref:Peptidase dimerization domain n=1 Tax=Phytophthora infestans TaxID=4787 RepID=A0A833TBS1_PHYIN|nr:Peptidase dimerization domain [Phytophthora infestans]KAF4130966.1 Peptidase dimerization domain [Phytophthora infestans]
MSDHEHDEHDQGDNEPKKAKQGSGKRLNDRQRVDIIQMAENSKISKRQLADKFGVTEAAIRKLLRKKDDFLRRYYDTPEEIRDQRLRGKSTLVESGVSNGNASVSTPYSGSTTPTRAPTYSSNLHSKSLYPPDDPWKQGLHGMLAKVSPFLKNFTQVKSQQTADQTDQTVDGAASTEDIEELDWIGFSRMLRDIRRGFHRYPETGYQEFRTQAFIRRFCEQTLHIPGKNIREMASTGLIVDVCYDNATISRSDKRKLPVLAFRADMDALPIEELNDHLPYCSTQKGGQKELRKRKKRKSSTPQTSSPKKGEDVAAVSCDSRPDVKMDTPANLLPAPSTITTTTIMAPPAPNAGDDDEEFQISTAAAHMCGHDGHMAMVLGLCVMVVRSAHLLPQDTFVRFLFQPAEEGPGGAMKMIKDGALTDVDEVYGCHNAPFPLYSIHVRPGAVMAHEVEFSIDIHGIGGHGSAPQQCVDPILAGSAVVQALQSVVSRSLSPMDTAVVSVTQFRGGDANNVIPSRVFLGGTIRDFDLQIAEKIKDRVARLVHSTCAAYGATANVHFLDGYAPVINPQVETRQVQQIAMDMGLYVSEEGLPLMAAEDFSYFLQERKGCYFFLGTKEDGDTEKMRALHSNHYDFNDKAIPLGIRLFLGILQSRFKCELYTFEEMQAFQVAMERIMINVTVV